MYSKPVGIKMCSYLQSLRKLVDALGHSSISRSTTMSPLLVSSKTAIVYLSDSTPSACYRAVDADNDHM